MATRSTKARASKSGRARGSGRAGRAERSGRGVRGVRAATGGDGGESSDISRESSRETSNEPVQEAESPGEPEDAPREHTASRIVPDEETVSSELIKHTEATRAFVSKYDWPAIEGVITYETAHIGALLLQKKTDRLVESSIGTFMNEFKESLLKEMTELLKTELSSVKGELNSVKGELKNVSMNQRNMYNYLVTSSRSAAAIPSYIEYSENDTEQAE
jgi:hypothetical protein